MPDEDPGGGRPDEEDGIVGSDVVFWAVMVWDDPVGFRTGEKPAGTAPLLLFGTVDGFWFWEEEEEGSIRREVFEAYEFVDVLLGFGADEVRKPTVCDCRRSTCLSYCDWYFEELDVGAPL